MSSQLFLKGDPQVKYCENKNNIPVVVITGAARGIGFALTKACLKRHMHVVMVDYAEDALNHAVLELSEFVTTDIMPVVCNVAHLSEVQTLAQKVFSRYKRVDWLINNAGISGSLKPVWEMEPNDIQAVFDVNLYGVIHGIKSFLPKMCEQQGRAKIINMASVYGLCSSSCLAAYAMSKHAVVALSESLYYDLRRLNKPVDVSVICPSFVNTDLLMHPKETSNALNSSLATLMERSRSPDEAVDSMLQEIEKNLFYILPDKEVKGYCEGKVQAILEQTTPNEHSLEKIIKTLSLRFTKKTVSG